MISQNMKRWMDYKGGAFLKDIGIKKGQIVLDFGCRHGTYAIPAAVVVGKRGKVYTVDKNTEHLDELMHRARERRLKNIERIDVLEEKKLLLSDECIDVVLLYDVLHLVENREVLLAEVYRVLKPSGILTVYPKHHQTHMNMNLEDVREEIESRGFLFKTKLFKILMHDDNLEGGYVLNFRKPVTMGEIHLSNCRELKRATKQNRRD